MKTQRQRLLAHMQSELPDTDLPIGEITVARYPKGTATCQAVVLDLSWAAHRTRWTPAGRARPGWDWAVTHRNSGSVLVYTKTLPDAIEAARIANAIDVDWTALRRTNVKTFMHRMGRTRRVLLMSRLYPLNANASSMVHP
jgi:hypothetical protein